MDEYLDLQDLSDAFGLDKEQLKRRIQGIRSRRKDESRHFPKPDFRRGQDIPFWKVERLEELTEFARLNGWIA